MTTRVRMKDTTAAEGTGALRAGEVYDLADEVADRLIAQGLAGHSNAQQTTAEAQAEAAAETGATPTIEEQAAAAGTRPGDQSTESNRNPQPLNAPPTAASESRTAAAPRAPGTSERSR